MVVIVGAFVDVLLCDLEVRGVVVAIRCWYLGL